MQVSQFISQRLWAPSIQVWQMGVCLLDNDDATNDDTREYALTQALTKIPGWEPNNQYMATPDQLAGQLIKQFPTDGKGALTPAAAAAVNEIALDALLLCDAVVALHPQVPVTTSLCMHAVPRCAQRLSLNAAADQRKTIAPGDEPELPWFVREGLERFQRAALGGAGVSVPREKVRAAETVAAEVELGVKKTTTKQTSTTTTTKKKNKKKNKKKKKKKKKQKKKQKQ